MNSEAFESQVFPFKNKLFRFALRFLGDEEDAKDVVQDVFAKVWNGRDQLNEVQNPEAWCMRITRNLALDRIRFKNKKQASSIEENLDLRYDALSPHESTEMNENVQHIARIVAALPEKQKQTIHLRDVEGYSYQEIAEILEVDINQVKVNLFRARTFVREKLMKINAYGL